MKKKISFCLSVFLTAVLTFLLTSICFILFYRTDTEFSAKITQIQSLIEKHAVFEFSKDTAEKNAVNGYLDGLEDSYRYYWTEEEYNEYLDSNQGHFSGIGISLQATNPICDGLFVYRVLGNSPAQVAGLKAGDFIVAVNGVSVLDRDYDEVYAELGVEEGKTLELTVQRNGSPLLNFSVTCAAFVQTYVDYQMIGRVGFIRIHSFNSPAVAEFEEALNELLSLGAKGFIFDLRNNLGGGLDTVEQILDLLVAKGEELVVLQFKDSESIDYSKLDPKTDVPMVVLINESSASASELMASCLRDVNNSVLIGTRSYGKGIGQTTYRLSDGSAVKFTTFYYLTKNRKYYHGVGLEPDIAIDLDETQKKYFYTLTEKDDPQLQAALSYMQTQIGE